MIPEWPPPRHEPPEEEPGQWPPPYRRQPVGIVATVIAVLFGFFGLVTVGFFILMAIALASWGNSK